MAHVLLSLFAFGVFITLVQFVDMVTQDDYHTTHGGTFVHSHTASKRCTIAVVDEGDVPVVEVGILCLVV